MSSPPFPATRVREGSHCPLRFRVFPSIPDDAGSGGSHSPLKFRVFPSVPGDAGSEGSHRGCQPRDTIYGLAERKEPVMQEESPDLTLEIDRLTADLAARGSALVAYSGGVDSAVVAALAQRALGGRALAVTAAAETLAGSELDHARRLAAEIGIRHEVVTTASSTIPSSWPIRATAATSARGCGWGPWCGSPPSAGTRSPATAPTPRTRGRTGRAARRARAGGLLAAPRHGVDKAATRAIARAFGLSAWDRPANACLSSRIPHGQVVTLGKLRRIEAAEEVLAAAGFRVVRVRHDGGAARVEVGPDEVSRLAAEWSGLEPRLRSLGFERVDLRPAGYRRGGHADLANAADVAEALMRSSPLAPTREPDQLKKTPEAVAAGDVSPAEALGDLAELPYADLGFAKLDFHRELRNGLPEAVYAEGKRTGGLAEGSPRG